LEPEGCLQVSVLIEPEAAIQLILTNDRKVRTADLNTSIMLQQRINVCFGEAALQRAGPTRTVILGRMPTQFVVVAKADIGVRRSI
jgi:hypothetical protein